MWKPDKLMQHAERHDGGGKDRVLSGDIQIPSYRRL